MGRRTSLEGFWDRPLQELFQLLQATPAGLTTEEASRRLRLYGPNSLVQESRFAALLSLFGFFANPLVLILVVASSVSLALGEHVGGLIIIAIVLFSVLLNFLMEFQARHAVEEIRKQIAITGTVMRDGREQELPIAQLVPGDILRLKAGDLVPADARGVNVAKDAAKIILLEKDLAVVNDGILEGRRSFANIMKYIIMGTSSNFGNMFSMAAASLFLPFLPMLPSQILLNNFLYDVSQVSIPSDNVDPAMVQRPKRWQIGFIRQFMMIIGPISSIYDFITFGGLLWVFRASTNESLFHTGWFVESLATQTLVVFVIRTAANPLRSRPSRPLLISVLAVVAVATVLPYTAIGSLLRFTPPPLSLLVAIAFLAVTYLFLVQAVKSWFYRRHALL